MSTIAELDFRGLNTSDKTKYCLTNTLTIENMLRDTYINRLQSFNRNNLESNPEPFRFLKRDNCSILILVLPYQFDFSRSCHVFFLSTPLKREEKVLILTDEYLDDLDSYRAANEFFHKKVLPENNYEKTQIIFELMDFHTNIGSRTSFFNPDMDIERYFSSLNLNNKILSVIRDEVANFQVVNKTRLSYFAKDVHKFPFSLLDLKSLIKLVNDDDFSYQLDQAMAAYHQNLFLPCAATLGVVLETLCIKILEKNQITIKTSETQLGVLKERLINERITTRRDNARLEVAYKMRNLASHTNPGITLKEDCHVMLNVINTIAFDYLNAED